MYGSAQLASYSVYSCSIPIIVVCDLRFTMIDMKLWLRFEQVICIEPRQLYLKVNWGYQASLGRSYVQYDISTADTQKAFSKCLPMGSFFYHCVAVASNCAFCARSVHSYATFSQFKRSCAPHCVSQCASDCDADRSSRQISMCSVFELLNIIFLNRKSPHVNLFVKLYISMKIREALFMRVF